MSLYNKIDNLVVAKPLPVTANMNEGLSSSGYLTDHTNSTSGNHAAKQKVINSHASWAKTNKHLADDYERQGNKELSYHYRNLQDAHENLANYYKDHSKVW